MAVDILDLVDTDGLLRYLDGTVPLAGPIEVSVLSGGFSNITLLVRSGTYRYVVRRRPLGSVPAGSHDMQREYRVLHEVMHTEVPVPRVFGYCQDASIVGAPFYVMTLVEGSVFHRRADVAGLSPAQGRECSDAVVDALSLLHRLDYTAIGLGQLGRPEGFVARRIRRWSEQWLSSPHRPQPLVEPLGRRLLERVPDQADSTLVHGDFRLGNILVGVTDPVRVNALLDWEMSTLGDPLTDLAHLLVYWEPTRGRLTHESQTIAGQPGFLTAGQLAERYASASGRDVSRLDFYLAFEHWRAAIIKEGIYSRHAAGQATDEGGEELGATVSLHLEEALDILGAGPGR